MRIRIFAAGAALAAGLMSASCGRVPQTAECQQFLACVAELDAARGTATDVARFEAEGGCWGSAEGAKLCTDACARGVEWLQRTYAEVASCAQ